MTRGEKIAWNKREKRIEAAWPRGVQVDVMKLGEVFKHGHALLVAAEGARPLTDEELTAGLTNYINQIMAGTPGNNLSSFEVV